MPILSTWRERRAGGERLGDEGEKVQLKWRLDDQLNARTASLRSHRPPPSFTPPCPLFTCVCVASLFTRVRPPGGMGVL